MHFQKDRQRLIDGSSYIAQQINGAVHCMLISDTSVLTQREELLRLSFPASEEKNVGL